MPRLTDQSPERLCLRCRYDLRGNASNACPECGRAFDPADPSTFDSGQPKYPRWLNVLNLLLLSHPLIVLVLFYAMMGLAWVELGHLPRVHQDNPSFYGFDFLLTITMFSCVGIPFTTMFGLFTLPHAWQTRLPEPLSVALRLMLWFTGIGLSIVLVRLDPGGCWEWIFD